MYWSEGDSDADMHALLPQRESRAEQRERKELRQLLSERYGLAAQIEDFVIPFHPTVLNRSVREIGLRRLTGASIIAIYRDSEHLIVPQAETVLLPGDVLALLGDRDQLEAAFRVLTEMAVQKMSTTLSPPQMAAVTIVCGSSFAGRTLAQLGLREELEVLIVEARRGTEHIANPGPDFQVENGDTLFFWGPSDHVEEARRRAAPIAGNNGE
jgi:monovalent cation:H+ antiporter-2, CPA2 family